MRFVGLIAGFAIAAAALSGCGGDDEAEPAPTGTASSSAIASPTSEPAVEDRAEAEALLKAAALAVEDLPEGFSLDEEKFTTNEELSKDESPYPGAPTLADLNRFGRILGYEADYRRPASETLTGATLLLQIGTDVYRDAKGADEHLELVRAQPSDPEFINVAQEQFADGSGMEVRDADMSPMSFAKVGEDRMAFEIKFKTHDPDLDRDFDVFVQFVVVRRERGIGSITVTAIGAPHPVGELEDLARTFDERMKDALE